MTRVESPPEWDAPPADLAARLAEDLAIFDEYEAGLAARLADYILDGTQVEALATITTIDLSNEERTSLVARHYRHPHMRGRSLDGGYDHDERAALTAYAARDAILFGPTPVPLLRRYADVAERVHRRYNTPGMAASPAWLRAFIASVGEQGRFLQTPLNFRLLSAARVLAMATPEEQPIASLIDCCFDGSEGSAALGLPGLGAVFAAAIDVASAAITALPARSRAAFFEAISASGDPATLLLLVNGLSDTARGVRAAAVLGVKSLPAEKVRETAGALLADPLPARRSVGIDMLAAIGDLAALEAHARTETSKPLRQKLAEHLALVGTAREIGTANPADGPEGYTALDGSWVAAPPLVPDADTLPADAAEAIAALDWVREGKTSNVAIGPDCPRRLVALMNGEVDPSKENTWLWQSVEQDAFLAICERPDVSITCLTRLCLAGESRQDRWFSLPGHLVRDEYMWWGIQPILSRRYREGGDLRHVLGATAKTGPSFAENVGRMLGTRIQPPDDEPLDQTIWAAVATCFGALDEALRSPNTAVRWPSDSHALVVLEMFTKTPARYLDLLMDRAIGGVSSVRAVARRRLEEIGDVQPLVVPLLEKKDPAVRAKAAQWLGERRRSAAIPPLRAALAKETSVEARAALLAALAACGDDIADQFSEAQLSLEAAQGLGKIKTDFSALFDRDRLPALHWADGRAVPAVVVRWWFARAHKLKRPAGDPLLHMALDRLDRGDAERLGATILASFVAFDTRRPALETANAYAEANAETYRRHTFGCGRI